YIVTQMFFDNQHYFKYVEDCKNMGIVVPIIPGLKPITKKVQLSSIPRSFYIDFPSDLVKEVQQAKDDAAVKEIGIEWCIAQSKELKAKGVPVLHYYTMGDSKTISKIIEATF
ncbi:MAG: methylenetetrahydrofolate reductase, partial [Saprospiraceae bacterium]